MENCILLGVLRENKVVYKDIFSFLVQFAEIWRCVHIYQINFVKIKFHSLTSDGLERERGKEEGEQWRQTSGDAPDLNSP